MNRSISFRGQAVLRTAGGAGFFTGWNDQCVFAARSYQSAVAGLAEAGQTAPALIHSSTAAISSAFSLLPIGIAATPLSCRIARTNKLSAGDPASALFALPPFSSASRESTLSPLNCWSAA